MTMDDDEYADDQKYAALEAEMSQPDENDSWTGSSQPRDDGGATDRPSAEYEAPAADDDSVERASLLADEILWQEQERARYSQQPQRRDVYDDPVGALAEVQQHMAQQRSRDDYQKFMGVVAEHENTFAALTPDYHQAAEHLEKARRSELSRMYPDNSPQAHVIARQNGFANPKQMRDAVFMNDAQTVARHALEGGRNPAQVYYELALDRGFKSKGGRSGGGRSSGRASGGRGGAAVSQAKLLDLYTEDPEEFDKQWDKMAKTGRIG